MTLVHLRFDHTLLAELARIRNRHARFQRLLRDCPTHTQIQTRTKKPEADLKRTKGRRYSGAALITLCLFLSVPLLVPEFTPAPLLEKRPPLPIVQIEHIPETVQRSPSPPSKRPVVPMAVESEAVPEDITIATTDLDFDPVVIDFPILTGNRPTVPSSEEEIIDLWDVGEKPELIRPVPPTYPPIARKAGIEGTVYINVLVGPDGRVQKAEVAKGLKILHKAALEAARQCSFKPARQLDRPVKVWVTIPIQFRLVNR